MQSLYKRRRADLEADCLLQARKDLQGGQGFVGLGDKSHRGYNNSSQLTSVQGKEGKDLVLEKFVVKF